MCCRILQFPGTLGDSGGAGIPDRVISVRNPDEQIKTATTGTTGATSEMYSEYRSGAYHAVFAGDDQYPGSQSVTA